MQTLETKQYLNSNLINNLPNEQDLNRKVTKSLEKCTNCIYSISNEPTLACFCIEEHLYKTGLQLVDKNEKMRQLDKQLSGALFDIEFSIDSIKRMKNTSTNFKATQDLIKDAIFHKQQIDYNNLNKRRFNQQMEKDHSINDFRKFTNNTNNTSNTRSQFQTKQNAFQRFSTSFEASIEGLASSASVEFKDAFKHITQLTSSNFGTTSNTSTNTDTNLNNKTINNVNKSIIGIEKNDDQPTTSTNKVDQSIKEESHKDDLINEEM